MSFTKLGTPLQRAFWWFAWASIGLPSLLAFRWYSADAHRTPRDGPFLLVANHTSTFDPFWIAWWLLRRSTFMASSALFRLPMLGWLLPLCGCFPKEKFVKDRDSMRTLAERYEAGDVIVLFPEGTRTFDGRTRPVLPGIGRLVKRLNARVVCARIVNGHLYYPRWARYPRWIRIQVEYDAPRTWDESATVEQINADISEAIRIPHEAPPTGAFAPGFRTAEGLPDYLWACPSCFLQEGLVAQGSHLQCRGCQGRWRVTTANRLEGTSSVSVPEAFDTLVEHFGDHPIQGRVSLRRLLPGRRFETVDEGQASIDEGGLQVGQTLIPFDELHAVSVEVQNRLTVRRGDELLELVPQGQSTLKWGHFLNRRLNE